MVSGIELIKVEKYSSSRAAGVEVRRTTFPKWNMRELESSDFLQRRMRGLNSVE